MNIFYINEDPIIAARELADDHIRKMQIESAQMCCTAHWETGGEAPYKRAHKITLQPNGPENLYNIIDGL